MNNKIELFSIFNKDRIHINYKFLKNYCNFTLNNNISNLFNELSKIEEISSSVIKENIKANIAFTLKEKIYKYFGKYHK